MDNEKKFNEIAAFCAHEFKKIGVHQYIIADVRHPDEGHGGHIVGEATPVHFFCVNTIAVLAAKYMEQKNGLVLSEEELGNAANDIGAVLHRVIHDALDGAVESIGKKYKNETRN